jgi:hypothetical protein
MWAFCSDYLPKPMQPGVWNPGKREPIATEPAAGGNSLNYAIIEKLLQTVNVICCEKRRIYKQAGAWQHPLALSYTALSTLLCSSCGFSAPGPGSGAITRRAPGRTFMRAVPFPIRMPSADISSFGDVFTLIFRAR